MAYRPTVSDEWARTLRQWHEAAYEELRAQPDRRMTYLGRTFDIPAGVFAPTPMSDLLGNAVLSEVQPGDRVLDMGTGCGVNAVLAASVSSQVVGVDINPAAVAAARVNAELNGVADRISFAVSDVFDGVQGRFDLIVFDPPFRWFAPRDLVEAAMADENYAALGRFMAQARDRLHPGGRMLLFFGSSGDIDHLHALADAAGFERRTVASRDLTRGDVTITYVTLRLTPRPASGPER